VKQNDNQVMWSLQKARRDTSSCHGYKTFQEFLDNQQYSKNGILRYEKIFGRTFISPGGVDTTEVCTTHEIITITKETKQNNNKIIYQPNMYLHHKSANQ